MTRTILSAAASLLLLAGVTVSGHANMPMPDNPLDVVARGATSKERLNPCAPGMTAGPRDAQRSDCPPSRTAPQPGAGQEAGN